MRLKVYNIYFYFSDYRVLHLLYLCIKIAQLCKKKKNMYLLYLRYFYLVWAFTIYLDYFFKTTSIKWSPLLATWNFYFFALKNWIVSLDCWNLKDLFHEFSGRANEWISIDIDYHQLFHFIWKKYFLSMVLAQTAFQTVTIWSYSGVSGISFLIKICLKKTECKALIFWFIIRIVLYSIFQNLSNKP